MTSRIPQAARWVIAFHASAMMALMALGEHWAGAWMSIALVTFIVSVIYFGSE